MLGMSNEALERLQNPPRENPSLSVDDDTKLALRLFLDNPSEDTYEKNRRSILLHSRMADASLPSYYRTTRLVMDLTGIESVAHHMCVKLCLAYCYAQVWYVSGVGLLLYGLGYDTKWGLPFWDPSDSSRLML